MEILPRELPFERLSDGFVPILECKQTVLDGLERLGHPLPDLLAELVEIPPQGDRLPVGIDHADGHAQLVRDAVSELGPNLRAAVTLYYLRELSLREMAEALLVPEATAKVWLFRGRQALKKKLESMSP